MNTQFRQGDVLLVQVGFLPEDASLEPTSVAPIKNRIILAEGELTGHAHAVPSAAAAMYQWQGDRLLAVNQATALTHEEHNPIALQPGIYKVVIQRQYDPARDAVRVVD